MKLSAPKLITWLVSLIVGVIGIILHLFISGTPRVYGGWLILIAFVLLILATYLEGL